MGGMGFKKMTLIIKHLVFFSGGGSMLTKLKLCKSLFFHFDSIWEQKKNWTFFWVVDVLISDAHYLIDVHHFWQFFRMFWPFLQFFQNVYRWIFDLNYIYFDSLQNFWVVFIIFDHFSECFEHFTIFSNDDFKHFTIEFKLPDSIEFYPITLWILTIMLYAIKVILYAA